MNRRQFFVSPIALAALGVGAPLATQKKVVQHELHLDDYIEVSQVASMKKDAIEVEVKVNTEAFLKDLDAVRALVRDHVMPALQDEIARHDIILFGPGSRQGV